MTIERQKLITFTEWEAAIRAVVSNPFDVENILEKAWAALPGFESKYDPEEVAQMSKQCKAIMDKLKESDGDVAATAAAWSEYISTIKGIMK